MTVWRCRHWPARPAPCRAPIRGATTSPPNIARVPWPARCHARRAPSPIGANAAVTPARHEDRGEPVAAGIAPCIAVREHDRRREQPRAERDAEAHHAVVRAGFRANSHSPVMAAASGGEQRRGLHADDETRRRREPRDQPRAPSPVAAIERPHDDQQQHDLQAVMVDAAGQEDRRRGKSDRREDRWRSAPPRRHPAFAPIRADQQPARRQTAAPARRSPRSSSATCPHRQTASGAAIIAARHQIGQAATSASPDRAPRRADAATRSAKPLPAEPVADLLQAHHVVGVRQAQRRRATSPVAPRPHRRTAHTASATAHSTSPRRAVTIIADDPLRCNRTMRLRRS